MSVFTQAELYAALRLLVDRIEQCAAAPEQTNAVVLASDLQRAIGNEFNPVDPCAAQRVRSVLPMANEQAGLPMAFPNEREIYLRELISAASAGTPEAGDRAVSPGLWFGPNRAERLRNALARLGVQP